MGNDKSFEELRDDVIAAYEESTDKPPNDYQMAEINILTREYLDGQSD